MMSQGADPNHQFDGFSVWYHYLLLLHHERESMKESKDLAVWSQVTSLLIKGGASKDVIVEYEKSSRPLDVLRSVFGEQNAQQFELSFQGDVKPSLRRRWAKKVNGILA